MLLRQIIRNVKNINPAVFSNTATNRCFNLNNSRLTNNLLSTAVVSANIENVKYKELADVLGRVQKEGVIDLKKQKVYAVVHIAGSQFKVARNDVIMINQKVEAECGSLIKFEKVLALGGRNFTLIGQPLLKRELVNVEAMVVEKTRGEKKHVFKKKRRKGYKRWKGHRQDISVLKINAIDFDHRFL